MKSRPVVAAGLLAAAVGVGVAAAWASRRRERARISDREGKASLDEVLGDWKGFISEVQDLLLAAGIDSSKYQMDHICYRCETVEQYRQVLHSLVPFHGHQLVESMIGGRPISIIKLRQPLHHRGHTVPCIELPCPKPAVAYPRGLEHCELVIGEKEDGVSGKGGLLRFMDECKSGGVKLTFDTSGMDKDLNADVMVRLRDGLAVKFHHHSIEHVVQHEKEHGHVTLVPPDYWQ